MYQGLPAGKSRGEYADFLTTACADPGLMAGPAEWTPGMAGHVLSILLE
jgi:hypothetical protein